MDLGLCVGEQDGMRAEEGRASSGGGAQERRVEVEQHGGSPDLCQGLHERETPSWPGILEM